MSLEYFCRELRSSSCNLVMTGVWINCSKPKQFRLVRLICCIPILERTTEQGGAVTIIVRHIESCFSVKKRILLLFMCGMLCILCSLPRLNGNCWTCRALQARRRSRWAPHLQPYSRSDFAQIYFITVFWCPLYRENIEALARHSAKNVTLFHAHQLLHWINRALLSIMNKYPLEINSSSVEKLHTHTADL